MVWRAIRLGGGKRRLKERRNRRTPACPVEAHSTQRSRVEWQLAGNWGDRVRGQLKRLGVFPRLRKSRGIGVGWPERRASHRSGKRRSSWRHERRARQGGTIKGGKKPGCGPRLDERGSKAIADEIVDQSLLAKADLGLGRVDVYVDLLGWHIEEEQHHREAGGWNHVPVSLGYRVKQQPVADKPLVHKHVDRVAVELLELGLGIKSAEAERSRRVDRLGGIETRVAAPRRWLGQSGAI